MIPSFVTPKTLLATIALAGNAVFATAAAASDTNDTDANAWKTRVAQSEAKKPASAAKSKTSPNAKAKAKDPASRQPTPPPHSQDRGEPAGQLQPQAHASNGGVTACFDSLARASSHVIDGEHRAFSFWNRKKPNDGTFRSIIALRYGGNISPRGAAVIINSPMPQSDCDATTIQVMPTARPCSSVQNDLMDKGRAVANLTGLALIQTPGDMSYLLLPTSGDGCTIVTVTVIRRN